MTWDNETSDIVQIEWRGASSATSQEAVDPQQGAEKTAEETAAQDLIEILKEGRKPAVEAQKLLTDAGHKENLNWSRVLHKAKGSTKRFPGERFFSWYLPTNEKEHP